MRTILSLHLIPVLSACERAIRDVSFARFLVVLSAALCMAFAPTSLAQEDEDDEDEEDQATVIEADEGYVEEVVVTGSRLKRDTYTSVAPLQIITGEVSREAGLIDAAEIVQKSTVSSGAQIDVTFAGFVLDDGPGTETANLRRRSSRAAAGPSSSRQSRSRRSAEAPPSRSCWSSTKAGAFRPGSSSTNGTPRSSTASAARSTTGAGIRTPAIGG